MKTTYLCFPDVVIYTERYEQWPALCQLKNKCTSLKVFARKDALIRHLRRQPSELVILVALRSEAEISALSKQVCTVQPQAGLCITFDGNETNGFLGHFDAKTHQEVVLHTEEGAKEAFFAPFPQNPFPRLYEAYNWPVIVHTAILVKREVKSRPTSHFSALN